MKKRIIAVAVACCLMAVLVPTRTSAAVTPHFTAVNDTLLPFNDDTMPFISAGEVFVPDRVLEGLGVWSISTEDRDMVWLYRGVGRYVIFHTQRGIVEDQDGNVLNWPSARVIGRRLYVPLRHVSEYFGFTFRIFEIPRSVIPDEQMWIVRIVSDAIFNDPTFIGVNERALRNSYNAYFAPPPPVPQQPTPTPVDQPPNLGRVTIYLSFYGISAGSAEGILDLLDIQTASNSHSFFFVSSADIKADPGLIRRIAGSGHTVGIWLEEGTRAEYLLSSALLFEAAKIRTVFVSAGQAAEAAQAMAEENGLLFWGGDQSFINYENSSVAAITATITREEGARQSLMFSCSESASAVLPGVYSFLSENGYSMARITETVVPIN